MVLIRRLQVNPFTRAPEGRWAADPALDRFLGSSRGVCEVLSRELPIAGLHGRRGWLEFYVRAAGEGPAEVEVSRSRDAGFGDGTLYIPDSFSALDGVQAARASLQVFDAALRELAQAYGWSLHALEHVRIGAERCGLRFAWQSPWKSAPDRRHEARGSYWLAEDGLGRLQVEVRPRGHDRITGRTAAAVAGTTAETLQRSAATLRWQDASHLTVVPWVDLAGQHLGLLSLDLDQARLEPDEGDAPAPAEPCLSDAPPRVLTRRVHQGALVAMDQDARDRARVWLQYGGESIGYKIRGGSIPATFRRAVEVVRDAVDGGRWLAATPYLNIQVGLVLDQHDEALTRPTTVLRTAAGDELSTFLSVDVTPLHGLTPYQLLDELIARLWRHLELVAQRRHLPPLPDRLDQLEA